MKKLLLNLIILFSSAIIFAQSHIIYRQDFESAVAGNELLGNTQVKNFNAGGGAAWTYDIAAGVNAISGSKSAHLNIQNPGGEWWGLQYKIEDAALTTVTKGLKYNITFKIKSSTSENKFQFFVQGQSGFTQNITLGAANVTQVISINTTPMDNSGVANFMWAFGQVANVGDIWIDDIVITELPAPTVKLVSVFNENFENATVGPANDLNNIGNTGAFNFGGQSAWNFGLETNNPISGTKSAYLNITNTAPDWWALQYKVDSKFNVTQGLQYKVTFKIKSSVANTILFKLEDVASFTQTLNLIGGNEMETFSIITVPVDRSAGTANFMWAFGNPGVPAEVRIDDIVIEEMQPIGFAPYVADISYCQGATAVPLTATYETNNELQWYSTATGGTALSNAPTPDTTTPGTTTYYVAQVDSNGFVSSRDAINVTVTPKPTAVVTNATICSGETYTWSVNSIAYTTSQTVTITNDACTANQVLNLTVTPKPTAVVTNATICSGTTYTWSANSVGYTTSQTVTLTNDGCTADQVLNLTVTPAPNAGSNGTLSVLVGTTPTNAQLFAGLNGTPNAGGSWSNVGNVYTYTVAATSPCTVAATATVTVSESIPTALSFCKGATVADAVLDSSLKFYTVAGTKGSPLAGTAALTTRTLYATQTVDNITSARVPVLITVYDLPTTPTPLVLTQGATVIKKVGNFIDTSTELTLTATAAGTVTTDHYNWVLPTDVNQKVGEATDGAVITINFEAVQAGTTSLDFLVSSVSDKGCVSKTAKKLTVTRSLPGAPKGLTITDAGLPLVSKITKLDAYTGDLKSTRVLTLTATPNVTAGSEATSYKWVLPASVTTTATPVVGEANTYTSSSNVISVKLANVTNETEFVFKVYGVNGNGTSVLSKDLTLKSAAAKTPGAITSSSPKFYPSCTATPTLTVQVPSVLGVTYAWKVNGASVTGSTNSIVITTTNLTGLTLDIAVTASNGYGESTAKTLSIKKGTTTCATVRMAPETATAEKFSAVAYPNPSTEGFRVKSSNGKSFGVQVYDMLGRSIEQRQMSSDAQIGSNYAKGIYNVIVNQGSNVKTLRVIKQ